MAAAAGRVLEVHFEVHVLEEGRWLIDYVTPEEEEARREALELSRRPEVEGVRLIKELYDPVRGIAAGRVLFSHLRPRSERPGRDAPGRGAPPDGPDGEPALRLAEETFAPAEGQRTSHRATVEEPNLREGGEPALKVAGRVPLLEPALTGLAAFLLLLAVVGGMVL